MSDAPKITTDDWGKLLLRLAVGGLMLFHGVHKLHHGVDPIIEMLTAQGLPDAAVYGVYVGELVAPLLIIAGLLTRLAGLIFAFNMGVAIMLAHSAELTVVNPETGAYALELHLLYLFGGLALACMGGGKLVVGKKS